jgi:hypothetical protein
VERGVQADERDEDAEPREDDPPRMAGAVAGDAGEPAGMGDSPFLFEVVRGGLVVRHSAAA